MWIRCQRDVEESARSCVAAYGWSPEQALDEMTRRAASLSEHLHDFIQVDFQRALEDPESFVHDLASSLDLHPTDTQLADAVKGIHRRSRSATS